MRNTVHEAIIAEILGDVGKLRDEVKQLGAILPAMCADFERKIELHTQAIIVSARNLVEEGAITEDQIRRYADEAARLAGEWAHEEIRRSAVTAATAAVREGVSSELGKASAQLAREVKEARNVLHAASEEVRALISGWSWFMLYLAAGLLGGCVVVAATWLGGVFIWR